LKIKFIRNVAWKVNLVVRLSYYKIAHHFLVLLKTAPSFVEMKISRELVWRSSRWCVIKGSSQNVTVFSNEDSFIWLRPPTHPLHMKVWKTEYRCIINQTPPKNIGFRTMYSPYACHDKGSIYESLSFQNHRHLISTKCTYNSTSILYQ
jgi:hypothetical protein